LGTNDVKVVSKGLTSTPNRITNKRKKESIERVVKHKVINTMLVKFATYYKSG